MMILFFVLLLLWLGVVAHAPDKKMKTLSPCAGRSCYLMKMMIFCPVLLLHSAWKMEMESQGGQTIMDEANSAKKKN